VTGAASWVWTLVLDWHGGPYYLSDRPITVGGVAFEAVLDAPAFEERLDLLPDAPGEQSVSVRFDLGGRLRELLSIGVDPRTATGVLRLVPVDLAGDPLAEGRLVAVGGLRQVVWGALDAPGVVEASIGREDAEETPILSPSAIIEAAIWPTAPEQSIGVPYPLVIGQPGWTGVGGPLRAGTRIWWITTTGGGTPVLGLVAGHPVAATQVDVYDATNDVWTAAVPVSSIADLAREWREWIASYGGGTRAAFEAAGVSQEVFFGVDLDGAIGGLSVIKRSDLGHSPGADAELYATWGAGRGLPEVRTAGDFLAWLLSRSGWTVDQGRTIAACRALSHEVAGAVEDADTTVEQYVQDAVLSMLPATLARGPAGVYPVVLSAETLDGPLAFTLTAGEDCDAIGAVAAEDMTGLRAVRVSYGWDGHEREYQGQAQAGTLPSSGSVVRSTSLGSRQLATRGAGGIEDVEGVLVRDFQTASRVAVEQLRRLNLAPVQRSYAAPADRVLELGDVGAVTDAAVGWSARRVLVVGREWNGARWLYRLAALSVV
jgi:hypothetical protein